MNIDHFYDNLYEPHHKKIRVLPMQNKGHCIKLLDFFRDCTGRFVSDLVGNTIFWRHGSLSYDKCVFFYQIVDRHEMAEQKPNKHLDKPTSTANSLPPGVQVDGRITPTKQEGRVTPTVPQAPPITIGQILSHISDAELLIDCVSMRCIRL